MSRIFYDDSTKSEAITRFMRGESSEEIAIKMNIHSGDLIRKWVQAFRKKHNLPADFRESDIDENVLQILQLQDENLTLKDQLEISLKALCLIARGGIKEWHELLEVLQSQKN